MNFLKTLGVLIILLSAVLLTSCSSNYYSASNPNKNGEVIVVGTRLNHLMPFASIKPKAWAINIKTGKKENLRVEFE